MTPFIAMKSHSQCGKPGHAMPGLSTTNELLGITCLSNADKLSIVEGSNKLTKNSSYLQNTFLYHLTTYGGSSPASRYNAHVLELSHNDAC